MTGNIIGEEFEKYVFNQISQRQTNQFSGYNSLRNEEQLQYLNNQNSWVKLASSVDILPYEGATRLRKILDEGTPIQEIITQSTPNSTSTVTAGGINFDEFKNELFSKQAILYNGLSSFNGKYEVRSGISKTGGLWDKTSTYGIGGTNYGLQPMPGITSVAIDCLNRGSIRNAIIEIKAYNKLQFAIIELLYLRLGFSMMLEWGNDKYIDNDSNYASNEYKPTFIETEWFEPKVTSQLELLEKIEKIRGDWNGNYDGFFGKVVNFDWSFESDGSYNITLKLVTLGDVIESIQANIPPPQYTVSAIKTQLNNGNLSGFNKGDPIVSAAQNTMLGSYLATKISQEDTWNYPTLGGIDYINLSDSRYFKENLSEQEIEEGSTFVSVGTSTSFNSPKTKIIGTKISNQYRYYITFGKLLDLVNLLIIPKLKLNNGSSPLLKIDSDYQNILISYHPNQISFDPRICIFKYNLNGQGFKINYKSINFTDILKEYIFIKDKIIGGQLANIYLNLDFIFKCLNNNSTDGKLSLFKFFQSICSGINSSLGDVNKIEPIIKEDNIITFIDQVSVPGSEKLTETGEIEKTDIVDLELYGYNPSNEKSNFVKGFDFKTEITPELASMVSIGATAGGSSVDSVEGTMFEKWNSGLKDRYSDAIILENEDVKTKTEVETKLIEEEADRYFEANVDDSGVSTWRWNAYEFSIKHSTYNINLKQWIPSNRTVENYRKKLKLRFREEFVRASKESTIAKSLDEITNDATKNYIIYLSRAFSGDVQFDYITKNGGKTKTTLPGPRDAQYLKYDPEFIAQGKGAYKKYITVLNNSLYKNSIPKDENEVSKSPSNTIGFIPVNLSITLQGISGVKIYNKLNINQTFLPYQYPQSLKFIIKKVNHRIIDNQWETNLETLSIPNIKVEDNFEYITNDDTPIDDSNFEEDVFILPSGSRKPIIPEDENAQFKIYDNYSTDGSRFETTVDKVLQDINVTSRSRFRDFLKTIESNYKGYELQINSIGRSIEEQKELAKKNKVATTRISTHNFNSALDINVFLPTKEMLGLSTSRATWINTGIPDIAKVYKIEWGGNFNNNYDPIHFFNDFDRNEAYEFSLNNPDVSAIDTPLSELVV